MSELQTLEAAEIFQSYICVLKYEHLFQEVVCLNFGRLNWHGSDL